MEKDNKENLESSEHFSLPLTALMIVITLILFWKEDVYDFCTIYLTVRISYIFR